MAISSGQQRVAGRGASRARLVRGRLWTTARMAALVVAGAGFVLVVAGMVPYAAPSAATSRREDLGSALSAVALVLLVVAVAR